jgi:hypothetical protein
VAAAAGPQRSLPDRNRPHRRRLPPPAVRLADDPARALARPLHVAAVPRSALGPGGDGDPGHRAAVSLPYRRPRRPPARGEAGGAGGMAGRAGHGGGTRPPRTVRTAGPDRPGEWPVPAARRARRGAGECRVPPRRRRGQPAGGRLDEDLAAAGPALAHLAAARARAGDGPGPGPQSHAPNILAA